jgi:serine/threonine protein kinase
VSNAPVRLDPGTAVGPYVVERRLAQGGMSVLYLARDTEGERVVLKMVPPDIATSSTRARLWREARALAAVDHPGVVRVHGTGEHEGMPWIVMDYVNGVDLKRVLADRGPLTADVALRYAIQAAEALVAAHDAGVIHRDLKPSNLLLTPEGRIVLVDFGIAKRRDGARDEDVLTSAREVLGTPAYLSPEQLEHGLADERSDVWSLGCVLYEMVVGTPPFGRGGSTTTAAILRDEPHFPSQVTGAIVHVISACLRKSSFARISSPRELLHLLRDALDDPSSALAAGLERSSSSHIPRASVRPSVRPSGTPGSTPPRGGVGGSTPPPRGPSSTRLSAAPISTRPSSSSPPAPRSASSMPASRPPSSAMRVAVARGRVKGTAIRAGLTWFSQTFGQPGLARLTELASPELQAILRPSDPALGLIASGWYDTQLIGELLGLVEHVAQPFDPAEVGMRLADAVARDNVGGVYRSLFRLVASPKLLEANAQRVWRTYVDEGTLSVHLKDETSFRAHVRGWSRHNVNVCRMLRPLLESLLREVGYRALTIERVQCVADGNTQCTFDATWAV